MVIKRTENSLPTTPRENFFDTQKRENQTSFTDIQPQEKYVQPTEFREAAYELRKKIRKCTEEGDFVKAEIYFNQLKSKYILTTYPFNSFIRAYSLLGDHANAEKYFKELVRCDLQPDNFSVNYLLETILRSKYISKLKPYYQCFDKFKVQPNLLTYHAIFRILIENNLAEQIDDYYNMMRKDYNLKPDIHTFYYLISGLCHRSDDVTKKVGEYLQMMEEFNIKPDQSIYSYLIRVYCNVGDMKSADEIYQKIKTCNDGPIELLTYTILIKGYWMHPNPRSMEKIDEIYGDIIASGIALDSLFFNSLISAAIYFDNTEREQKYLDDMKALGIRTSPVFYNTLIGDCIKRNDTNRAAKYLGLMKMDNINVDIATLTNIMKLCIKNHDFEACEALFTQARDLHLKVDQIFLNSSIRSQAILSENTKGEQSEASDQSEQPKEGKDSNFDRIEMIISYFPKFKIKPDIITINSLIYNCVSSGNIEKADEYYNLIPQFNRIYYGNNEVIKPTAITFNTLMNCCYKNQNFEKAEEYFNLMLKSLAKPTAVSFNIILNLNKQRGDLQKVEYYYNLMKELQVKPEILTFNEILHTFKYVPDKHKELEKFDYYVGEMQKSGLKPNKLTLLNFVTVYPPRSPKKTFYSKLLNTVTPNAFRFYDEKIDNYLGFIY